MKRLLAILVTLSALFALSACGSAPQQGEQPWQQPESAPW